MFVFKLVDYNPFHTLFMLYGVLVGYRAAVRFINNVHANQFSHEMFCAIFQLICSMLNNNKSFSTTINTTHMPNAIYIVYCNRSYHRLA